MSEMTQEQKDAIAQIRAKTLGSPVVKTHELVKWNGVELEVRRPSLRDSRAIEEGSVIGVGKKAKADNARKAAMILLHCVYLPGTDFKPYTRHDVDAFEERSEDDFIGALLEAFSKMSEKKREAEAIEKNSEGVQTAEP